MSDTMEKAMSILRQLEDLKAAPGLLPVSEMALSRALIAVTSFADTLRPGYQSNALPRPSSAGEALGRVLPIVPPSSFDKEGRRKVDHFMLSTPTGDRDDRPDAA